MSTNDTAAVPVVTMSAPPRMAQNPSGGAGSPLAAGPSQSQSQPRSAVSVSVGALAVAEPMPVSALPISARTTTTKAHARVSLASQLGFSALAMGALAAVVARSQAGAPRAAVLVSAADVSLFGLPLPGAVAGLVAAAGTHKAAVYATLAAVLLVAALVMGRAASKRHRGATGAAAVLAHSKEGAVKWRAQSEIRASALRTQQEQARASQMQQQHQNAALLRDQTNAAQAAAEAATATAQAEAEARAAAEAAAAAIDIDDPKRGISVPFDAEAHQDTPQLYINAEKGNVVKGHARYIKTMQWRASNGIDRILNREHPLFRFIKKNTHQFFAGCGRAGHFVYYERPKGANLPAFTKAGVTLDELIYHFVYITEFLYVHLDTNPDAKCISVVDCTGIGLSDFGGAVVDFVKKISAVTQTHYPERSAGIICINAPFSFRMVWAIVKKMMDPVTRNKTHILGGSFLKEMDKVVANDQIPKDYGGSRPYTPAIPARGPELRPGAIEPRFDVDVLPLSPEEERLFQIADKYNLEASRRYPDRPLVRGSLTVEALAEQPAE